MVASSRILVVDDEPVVTESCRRILCGEGYDVSISETGRDGLNRVSREDFDLVVTDLKMPDLSGMDLVRVLRQTRPKTPIVVITGYGTVASAVEATRLGVSDYIQKPFTPGELTKAVVRALGADQPKEALEIDADLVKQVLRRAGQDEGFWKRLFYEGSRALEGVPLCSEAKAAIVSGDIGWIESHCGRLEPEEVTWLKHRTEAEIW